MVELPAPTSGQHLLCRKLTSLIEYSPADGLRAELPPAESSVAKSARTEVSDPTTLAILHSHLQDPVISQAQLEPLRAFQSANNDNDCDLARMLGVSTLFGVLLWAGLAWGVCRLLT